MQSDAFFRLEQLSEGVYAAIVHDGTGALGNAGFIDLGGATFVFDTFQSLEAARDLLGAAERITGNPVRYVLNSHWHADHVLGNQVFASTCIISTAATRQLMSERLPRFLSYATEHPEYPAWLRSQLTESLSTEARWELERDIGDTEHFSAQLDRLELCLPTLCFHQELTISGTKRSIRLQSLGGGHSLSDAFVWLPDERVLFAGDLVFAGYHPALKTGEPLEWLRILDELAGLDVGQVVSGHGPVGTMQDIHATKAYIADAVSRVQASLYAGEPIDALNALQPPDPYSDWRGISLYQNNLRFLHDWLTNRTN